MILETSNFKIACSKILSAIDNNNLSEINDILELKVDDNVLYLNSTNKEYYISIKFPLAQNENFKATIKAETFLKLISQITTDTITLTTTESNLIVKGNGTYKIPLIFEGESLLEIPKINIDNVTVQMDISKTILDSINNYNSKEIIKENITKPIQKMYYVDELGCITFTSTGACVNNFNLEKPIKMLLNNKIVKLFKLFKSNNIWFRLGYDAISENIIQTKVSFSDDEVTLNAILSCDDTMLNSIPVEMIRNRLSSNYPYSVVLDKAQLSQALSRLAIFNKNLIYNYYKFTFDDNSVLISDDKDINTEKLNYQNRQENLDYSLYLNINELKTILDGCSDPSLNLLFGNQQAVVVVRKNIRNLLMEGNIENGV